MPGTVSVLESLKSASMASLFAADSSVRFVFVGGKGGVGKTTCSSSVAIQFAKARPDEKILLISTDPAHNLSDAFMQNLDGTPKGINGVSNLYAMETDPAAAMKQDVDDVTSGLSEDSSASSMAGEFKQWLSSVPGIDEAVALSRVLNLVESGEYSVVIFDTAPTGHTLRLLQLPIVLKVGLSKLQSWKAKLGGLLGSVAGMVWGDGTDGGQAEAMQKLEAKLQEYQIGVETIARIFADSKRTTFVCVCIAEHLSVFETLRLVGELKEAKIASKHIICNQLVPRALSGVLSGDADKVADVLQQHGVDASVGSAVKEACELMGARARIQKRYLAELIESLPDHSVLPMPLLPTEVRGVKHLRIFSELLVHPDHRLTGKESGDQNPLAGLTLMAEGTYSADTEAKFLSSINGADAADEVVEAELAVADFPVGATVSVHSLKGKPEYNGLSGTVVGNSGSRVEVRVRLPTKKMRKLALKPSNLSIVEDGADEESKPAAPAAPLTPEMMGLVQRALMAPGGIKALLAHPKVVAMKENDSEMKPFFRDIEGGGLFAAMKYLGNQNVMGKLAAVAKEIL